MTTAADLRADARYVLVDRQQGVLISIQNPAPAGEPELDPATGDFIPSGQAPAALTGFGWVTRFSDTLAATPGLIENGDRKILFYPNVVPGEPAADGVITTTQADGTTADYRVIAWTTRELGGEVVHYVVQGRR
jgi:hypothetical protein